MVRGCRLGVKETSGVCARRRRAGARGTGVRARRRGAVADGGLAPVVRGGRGGRNRRGDRDAARTGGREPDGARLRRPLDQPEAARPFPDRFSPAGAKDDRRDARVLASALRTDPHCLRRPEPTDPAIIALREWSRLDEDLTRERVRLANRMRQQLWRYYPQFLDAVDDDVAAPWALNLWQNLPTPRAGQRVREVTLTRVLKQHRIRRISASTGTGPRRPGPSPRFPHSGTRTRDRTAARGVDRSRARPGPVEAP